MQFSHTAAEKKRKAQLCVAVETKGTLLYIYTCSLRGKKLRFLKLIKAHIYTYIYIHTYAISLRPLIP